MTRLDDYR